MAIDNDHQAKARVRPQTDTALFSPSKKFMLRELEDGTALIEMIM
jgi:hypothetical protein